MPVLTIVLHTIPCEKCPETFDRASSDGFTNRQTATTARAFGWTVGRDTNRCPAHRGNLDPETMEPWA